MVYVPTIKGLKMSTRAKCYKLAASNDIEIEIDKTWLGYEYSLSVPKGYQLEDYEGARKGLSIYGCESAKVLWAELYHDLETIISYKPWFKIPDSWQ